METWELVARESIRDRIARWNANGDAGRFDAMVEVLAPDVEFQAADSPVLRGRDAVLAFLTGVPRDDGRGSDEPPKETAVGPFVPPGGRPSIRHFTSTMLIDFTSDSSAQVRSYYAVLSSFGPDHWGRYLDEFGIVDGTWLITKRTITTEGVNPGGWAATFR